MSHSFKLPSGWTSDSSLIIDDARGAVYYSKATTRGQLNRIFKNYQTPGQFKHLSNYQASDFWIKNKVAEFYLAFIRNLTVVQIGRGCHQASYSYIKRHQDFFMKPYNTMQYPVSQNGDVGYVRSALDRQKLVDYMSKLTKQSIQFGQMGPHLGVEKTKELVVDKLRSIAFAPRVKAQ